VKLIIRLARSGSFHAHKRTIILCIIIACNIMCKMMGKRVVYDDGQVRCARKITCDGRHGKKGKIPRSIKRNIIIIGHLDFHFNQFDFCCFCFGTIEIINSSNSSGVILQLYIIIIIIIITDDGRIILQRSVFALTSNNYENRSSSFALLRRRS